MDMGKQKRTEEVPQWIRDFITQRQEHQPEEREGEASHNTYLLCPFNQAEVEAIRGGVYKLREETFMAIAEENRKSREAGHFVPDSGISHNEPISELYFRNLLLMPLSKREMQEAVVRHYGWEKWSEDPWGDFSKFCEWINGISNDERDVWAINDTFGGRVYLTYWILEHLSQFDYSEITEEDFLPWIGVGAENFLRVKSYTGWDDFQYHYPDEPLPARFVNEQIIKVYLTCPFSGYRWFINSIYLWYFALKEARERAKGSPELEGFLDYHAATDAHIADLCQKLAPKDYHFPDKNQAWEKLEQSLKKPLDAKERRYADVLGNGGASTLGSLLEGVTYWKSKAAQATIAGLKGQLGNGLLSIVEHDFIDAAKKAYRIHEVTESQIDATRVTDEEETTPFLDRIPTSQLGPEQLLEESESEALDLKRLGFNKDELTPKELLVLDELTPGELQAVERVREALSEGCSLDSKTGNSLRQYLGDDYQKTMRAFARAKAKLKKALA